MHKEETKRASPAYFSWEEYKKMRPIWDEEKEQKKCEQKMLCTKATKTTQLYLSALDSLEEALLDMSRGDKVALRVAFRSHALLCGFRERLYAFLEAMPNSPEMDDIRKILNKTETLVKQLEGHLDIAFDFMISLCP